MSENEDLKARIEAIERQLTPDLSKMSTIKASNELKGALNQLKENKELHLNGTESFEDVIWKLFEFYEAIVGQDLVDVGYVLERYID
jgi:hypothetical protein